MKVEEKGIIDKRQR